MNANLRRRNFLNQLFLMFKTAHIHDSKNQAFRTAFEQLEKSIVEILAEEEEIRVESVGEDIYINREKVRSDITSFGLFQYLLTEFNQKNVGGIIFFKAPTFEEVADFFKRFSIHQDLNLLNHVDFNRSLVDANVSSMEVLEKTERKSVSSEEIKHVISKKKQALTNYVRAMDVMKLSTNPTKANVAECSRKARRVVYQLVDICLDEGFSFFGLSNIKNYDEYTFNHSVNVCVIAIGFGKNLALTKKQIGELGVAALFHDYGKVMIPREILNKPGKFNPEEWLVMKSHPLQSVKTMLALGGYQETDIKKLIAAFEHHRNFDRSGYPETGLNKPMNFYSKIVAIADAYDAMTTNRVYQKAMLPTVALKILSDNAGTKFDPLLVKAFINTIGVYPVGTTLQFTNGSFGIVTANNKDPVFLYQPTVRVVADASQTLIENGPEYDFAKPDSVPDGLGIAKAVHPEEHGINVTHHLFGDAIH